MGKIYEMLGELKDRFRNPLVFSFFISWIICNWPVTLAVLWHNSNEIKSMGFQSTFDFIRHNLEYHLNWETPILVAFVYSFLMPFSKTIIGFFSALADRATNWTILKVNKGAWVPFNNYYNLELKNSEKQQKLSEMIQQSGRVRIELAEIKAFLEEEKQKSLLLKESIKKHELFSHELTDDSMINGEWDVKFYKTNSEEQVSQNWKIENGQIYHITMDDKHYIYNIRHYYYNNSSFKLLFVGINPTNSEEVAVFDMKISGISYMEGWLNGRRINFQRSKPKESY